MPKFDVTKLNVAIDQLLSENRRCARMNVIKEARHGTTRPSRSSRLPNPEILN
jgi:hypothetical protein